ncbi:hypothetical protein HanPI659440_Chr09g0331451 [Helianthus annuus]|nr:hypothetical protein HanPI659440_Chr09g0331451 [Helianthus annuus]
MARVLQFEVSCRASGYDPTLLSFRRFFRLAKNGDWFTFETTQVDTCLISSMVSTLGVWKYRFFWVSEEIVPFKLVWRHPDAVLNEPEPSAFDINARFLETLRECPSRIRPFPEHLLVLLDLSKLWEKRNRDPVLLRDGQVMSALDFIKSDDTSDVAFDDAAATPGEDVVVRGSDHRFEGSRYVNVPNVKGFTKAAGSKASVRRSKRYLKGADQPSGSEPIDVRDDIEVSAEQAIEVDMSKGKEKELVLAWVKKVGQEGGHEIEVSDLRKSFEADQLKLKADREALAVQQKAFDKEKYGLKALVAQATGDNQWIIEQGFQQVVTYLLHSKEFNSALGEVYTKQLNLGKHKGLIAGYKLQESGHPLEKSPLYRPEASEVFKGSVEQMERLTYPYVSQVAACFGKSLSVLQELKPDGLNEKVCAEVLGSLSRKRSYSGDSEDTFSGELDAAKDASLDGSTVDGDGGSKAKKSKKTKKAKGNSSGASKPSADA